MKSKLTHIIILCMVVLLLTSCSAGFDNKAQGDLANNAYPEKSYGNVDDAMYDGENPPENMYDKFIENEYVKTETEPVSTFSTDVDTASYSYFRKLVNSGYDISELKTYAGNSIRTEEMLNYFNYSSNTPAENDLFGVKTQIADCPWNSEAVLMYINLKAKDTVQSAGNNLVFLIDVSGSMNSEDKLPLLKQSFAYLTATLTDKDTVSIVTYSGRESVVLDGCAGNKTEEIMKAVNTLEASGSTNGEAGLQKAYDIAKKNIIEGGNNRIIMASDGDLNVGISSEAQLKKFVEDRRGEGIYLSVLGFGTGNYKDSKMETLADNGNGVYYYIDGTTEAEKVFGTDLSSTLLTVAEDVKLQLTFAPEYINEYRLVGYENRLLSNEDFTDDKKDAGEVGSGHTVTVCYELKLTDSAKAATEPWMKLAIRYKNPGEDVSNLNEYNLGAEFYTTQTDTDYRFICAVIELSMYLHGSPYAQDINIDSINETLQALDLTNDGYKAEFSELIKKLAGK